MDLFVVDPELMSCRAYKEVLHVDVVYLLGYGPKVSDDGAVDHLTCHIFFELWHNTPRGKERP